MKFKHFISIFMLKETKGKFPKKFAFHSLSFENNY